jgi:hypothetical protein
MIPAVPQVRLSPIDEERFGIRTARAPLVTLETLPGIIEFCHANAVSLLIARCEVTQIRTVQAMERQGFELMDTLVYYCRRITDGSIPPAVPGIEIRSMRADEDECVARIATQAFDGYCGHYHADERLDPRSCTEAYVSWARRLCADRSTNDEVLVAQLDGELVGFGAVRLNTPTEGEGVLFGVAPAAQRRGVYRSLIVGSLRWCLAREACSMVYSTQIANLSVERTVARLGFETQHAYYTFHRWFQA